MYSNDFDNTTNNQETPYNDVETALISISLTAMSIISIFGNVLVFVAYCKEKTLQRPTNYLILSLASADIIVATFVVNIHTMYMVMGWPFTIMNYSVCLLWLTVDYWVFQVSVFGVLLIAGDRYMSIKYPHGYRRRRTANRIKIAILLTWVISFLIWVPLILGYAFVKGVEDEMTFKNKCDVGSSKVIPATVIGCCVSYIVPIIIVSFFAIDSIQILLKLKTSLVSKKNKCLSPNFPNPYDQNASLRSENRIREPISAVIVKSKDESQTERDSVNKGTRNSNIEESGISCQDKLNKTRRRLRSVSRISHYQWIATFNVLLAMSFLINILPFGVLAVTRSVCLHVSGESCVSTEWWYFGYIMCYLNSMLNPLCYAFGNKNFKRAFKSILCRRNRRKDSVPTLTITEDSIFQTNNPKSFSENESVSLESMPN